MKKTTPTFTGVAFAIAPSPNAADSKKIYDAASAPLIRRDKVWGLKAVWFVLGSVKAPSFHLVIQGYQQMFFLR